MPRLHSWFVLVVFCALLCAPFSFGQASSTPTPSAPKGVVDQAQLRAVVTRAFGTHFELVPAFQPVFGDFDADGTEDLAVVASGQPQLDQAEYKFNIVDPYDSYFGYGNAKLLMAFPTTAERPLYVLILHDWRAPNQKAKFVIVNLPFEKIQLSHVVGKKKKLQAALFVTDKTGVQAEVFWDGRKYRWVAVGAE